jgi:hypothetical protein
MKHVLKALSVGIVAGIFLIGPTALAAPKEGTCVPLKKTQVCAGKCGDVDDGCDGTYTCNPCSGGKVCDENNTCVAKPVTQPTVQRRAAPTLADVARVDTCITNPCKCQPQLSTDPKDYAAVPSGESKTTFFGKFATPQGSYAALSRTFGAYQNGTSTTDTSRFPAYMKPVLGSSPDQGKIAIANILKEKLLLVQRVNLAGNSAYGNLASPNADICKAIPDTNAFRCDIPSAKPETRADQYALWFWTSCGPEISATVNPTLMMKWGDLLNRGAADVDKNGIPDIVDGCSAEKLRNCELAHAACGKADNGCSGTVDCGTCPNADEKCINFQCVKNAPDCTPKTENVLCQDGAICGTVTEPCESKTVTCKCAEGKTCNANKRCVAISGTDDEGAPDVGKSVVCGNETCDDTETCTSCPTDCGACPDVVPPSAVDQGCTMVPNGAIDLSPFLFLAAAALPLIRRRAQK